MALGLIGYIYWAAGSFIPIAAYSAVRDQLTQLARNRLEAEFVSIAISLVVLAIWLMTCWPHLKPKFYY